MGPDVVDFHRSILDLDRLIPNGICLKMPRRFRPLGDAAKNGVGFLLRQIPAAEATLPSDFWRSGGKIELSMSNPFRRRPARARAPRLPWGACLGVELQDLGAQGGWSGDPRGRGPMVLILYPKRCFSGDHAGGKQLTDGAGRIPF